MMSSTIQQRAVKSANGWKAYDIIVGGVSLVTNYRDEFNAQVQSGGIDGLIKTLASKNSSATPPPPPVVPK